MRFAVNPRTLWIVLAAVVAVALPLLSFDFGITEDEQLHDRHGESILDYFRGESDLAVRDPFDRNGALTFLYDDEMNDLSGALNIYGGVFDLLCNVMNRYVSPFGRFETRHLVNSLFGLLLIAFAGLAAREIGGWRAACIALLLAAASPRIVGHSMNNPVDLPFAALYLFVLYFLLRFVAELPRPTWKTCVPLLIGIPLAIDVRVAGLVLVCYLGLFVAVRCLRSLVEQGFVRDALRSWVRPAALTLLVGGGGYLLASVLWPLAHGDPLGTPLMALGVLSRLETFNALDLFEGTWIHREEIPWYFVPKWILIGTPLFVPLGLLLSPLLLTNRFAKGRTMDREKILQVAFAFLFPLFFIIVRKSNVYNDARHALFVVPPLIVFCALAYEQLFRSLRKPVLQVVAGVVVAATMLEPIGFMIRNHPNEGVYFSPLIGGVNGAWKQYETDFWGNSVRQGVEWIQDNVTSDERRPVRVRLWYGDQTKGAYYVAKQPGFVHVVSDEDSNRWDYSVLQTVAAKYFPAALGDWPPFGTVYEIKADETPLAAVVMNYRGRSPEPVLERMWAWAEQSRTHATYVTLASMCWKFGRREQARDAFRKALELRPVPVDRSAYAYHDLAEKMFGAGYHEEAIAAFRLSLERHPTNPHAHEQICKASIELERWEEAKQACEAALAFDPGLEEARRNLRVAQVGLARSGAR